jgi:hypothetical protein
MNAPVKRIEAAMKKRLRWLKGYEGEACSKYWRDEMSRLT